mmetsp:Transcript_43781/g.82094  ORF Transcript_43781/g.82094 Transcript_43781/m.82094 type:complete len:298 (-) Transcript_43781:127-1020(-)
MAPSHLFLLSCFSVLAAFFAKEHATCSGDTDATCNIKRALAEDGPLASGIAVELLQKQSSVTNPEKPGQEQDANEQTEEVPDKDAVLQSVIKGMDEVSKTSAQLKGKMQDGSSDYTMQTVKKEMQDAPKQSSTEDKDEEQPVSYFKLLATGKWCDNMGKAEKSLHGVAASGHTMSSCQGACNKDGSCKYFSFDRQKHWCTTWWDCGELTETPHRQAEANEGWVVYKKVDEQEHVEEVVNRLKDIAKHPLDKHMEDDVQLAKDQLKDAKAVEQDFEDELKVVEDSLKNVEAVVKPEGK